MNELRSQSHRSGRSVDRAQSTGWDLLWAQGLGLQTCWREVLSMWGCGEPRAGRQDVEGEAGWTSIRSRNKAARVLLPAETSGAPTKESVPTIQRGARLRKGITQSVYLYESSTAVLKLNRLNATAPLWKRTSAVRFWPQSVLSNWQSSSFLLIFFFF